MNRFDWYLFIFALLLMAAIGEWGIVVGAGSGFLFARWREERRERREGTETL